jgi:iron(III) transport system permease protein
VLGVLGAVVGFVAIVFYLRLTRQASRYAVVTGKAYRPRVIRLNRWKYLVLAMLCCYLCLSILAPVLIIGVTSFQRFYQPLVPGASINWTLANYSALLDYRFFGQYLVNTILVSLSASSITMLVVSFLAWQIVRWPSRLTRAISVLAFLPLAIPGVIFSLAFLLAALGTPLYGTLFVVIVAFCARYLAYSTRLMHAAQLQIHRELEEAALTCGVNQWKAFFLINLRLLTPAFVNGWLWILIHVARDFTTPLMLGGGSALLLSNVIFDRFSSANFPVSAAMIVWLVIFNLTAVLLGHRWIARTVGVAN